MAYAGIEGPRVGLEIKGVPLSPLVQVKVIGSWNGKYISLEL